MPAPDGSIGVAWAEGVCVVTPMESGSLTDLLSGGTDWVGHDIKSTMHLLADQDLPLPEFAFDTALAAYDLNPTQSDYPVSKLATNYLGMSVEDGDAAACAEAVWNLRQPLTQELQRQEMERLYNDIELPLCDVLYRMERAGIAIDRDKLVSFGSMLAQRIDQCEQIIFSYSEEPFNINSTKQLGTLLFEKLELAPSKRPRPAIPPMPMCWRS